MKLIYHGAHCARILLCLAAVLLPMSTAHASPDIRGMTAALDHILADPALSGGITGAVVVRVSDGATLYSHNENVRLLPASNRKLFTAAAALGVLGDNWVYKTQVLSNAKPDADGTITGDVVLQGAGDSALTTADLDDLAAQMARAGIKRIDGDIIGDGTRFTDGPYGFGWEWDDFSDEEFPVLSGLEVNDGDAHVHAASGAVGKPVVITLTPLINFPTVVNTAQTVAAGAPNTCVISRPYGTDTVLISGSLPQGLSLDQNVPVPDPAQYAGQLLAYCLHQHGIEVRSTASHLPAFVGMAKVVLASHTSVPLTQYLPLMMKPSDNLIAESLVRTEGAAKGTAGTYEAGHALETPFFQSLGVDTPALDLRDGSGVSRRDFVTARAVGQLLVGMAKRPDFASYYDALPIAGVDGTLKSRMRGTRAAGNVHAKTGTLSQARALSGYVRDVQGRLYAFSLLMNNFPGNARSAGNVQDAFAEYLASTVLPAP